MNADLIVVGGGPAGRDDRATVRARRLSRHGGCRVTVLEKHADFFRTAIAAANILAGPSAADRDVDPLLHKVQQRRLLPTRLVQAG